MYERNGITFSTIHNFSKFIATNYVKRNNLYLCIPQYIYSLCSTLVSCSGHGIRFHYWESKYSNNTDSLMTIIGYKLICIVNGFDNKVYTSVLRKNKTLWVQFKVITLPSYRLPEFKQKHYRFQVCRVYAYKILFPENG